MPSGAAWAKSTGRLLQSCSPRGLSDGEYRLLELYVNGAPLTEDSDPWAHGDLPVHRGGLIAEIIRTRKPALLQDLDWSADPVFRDSLAGYDSVVAVPFAGDHLPMSWIIVLRAPGAVYRGRSGADGPAISLIGSLLDSRALTEEVAKAHALVDKEVRRVGRIRRNLLPNPLPRVPGLEIATSYETFGEAGGDLYEFAARRS